MTASHTPAEVTPSAKLLPCERCQQAPSWGGINYYDKTGKPARDWAIRCLHCHYWFYVGDDPVETARRWNERPCPALPDGVGEIVEKLRRTARDRAQMERETPGAYARPPRQHVEWQAADTIVALQARVAALEGGLRPFADAAVRIRADDPNNDRPALATAADYRIARALLADAKAGDAGEGSQ